MYSESKTKQVFEELRSNIWTPDCNLTGAQKVLIKSFKDIDTLPKTNCAYWISTNEPVYHTMHLHKTPTKNGNEEIVYNGVANGLRGRMHNHLLREKCEGMSGISVDLYFVDSASSHIKKAYSPNISFQNGMSTADRRKNIFVPSKSAKKGFDKPSSPQDLLNIYLSEEEQSFVNSKNSGSTIWLYNGINVMWDKHKNYDWFVHYYECDNNMSAMIEKVWRERFGYPRLISYTKGR
jgi:hypothetical protein